LAQLVRGRVVSRAVVAGFILITGVRFTPLFLMTFPSDVEIQVLRTLGNPKRALTVSGSLYVPLAIPVARPDLALVNAQLLFPIRAILPAPAGDVLLRIAHPLAYLPFQYDCHTPRERTLLRTHDISMRLIRLSRPGEVPADPPVAMRYTNADRPDGYDHSPH
jgi:hypothetical protein